MKINISIPLLLALLIVGCGNKEQPVPAKPAEPSVPVVLREPSAPAAPAKPAAAEPVGVAQSLKSVPAVPDDPPRKASLSVQPRKTALSSNDLALVNGLPVPAEEFYRVFAGESLDSLPNYLRREYNRNRENFIDQLINNKIFEYAASRENFSANPQYQKDIDDAILKVNMRYFYDAYIADKVSIKDSVFQTYYDAHTDEYMVPERIRASHILVALSPTALPSQADNAHQKIMTLRRRVLEGESFEEIAAAESDCPSKAKGGDLGFFSRGQMSPSFEKTAFALEKNDISDIVETEFGYHIIKVTDRIPERRQSFDEAKAAIKSKLEDDQEQILYTSMLQTLTNKYEVIRNETLIRKLVNSY